MFHKQTTSPYIQTAVFLHFPSCFIFKYHYVEYNIEFLILVQFNNIVLGLLTYIHFTCDLQPANTFFLRTFQ